jgi:hypothetical protein
MIAFTQQLCARIVVGAFVVASGAASEASPEPIPSASARPYALTCPTAAPAPLARGDAAWLVEVDESGGLAARHTQATIRADGAMWIDGCAVALDDDARARLASAVDAAAATTWPRSTRTGSDCCDQIFTLVRLTLARDAAHPKSLGLTSSSYGSGPPAILALIAAVREEAFPYSAYRRRMQNSVRPTATPS